MEDIRMWYSFLSNSPVSIVAKKYFFDGKSYVGGEIVRASHAKAEHHDRKIEEILGLTDFDLLPLEQANKILADDIQVMLTKKPIKYRVESVTHKNGKTVWKSVSKWPMMHGDFPYGVLGISIDITEQVETEERLKLLNVQVEKLLFTIKAPLEKLDLILRKLRCQKFEFAKRISEAVNLIRAIEKKNQV